jgi:hypothetical protein
LAERLKMFFASHLALALGVRVSSGEEKST